MEDGRWKMEDGRWKMENSEMVNGGWKRWYPVVSSRFLIIYTRTALTNSQ
ncbi:MAG: hypothetical protein JKX74_08890 [Flavobacteriales bacterium]|nr:hypothetical protein [Flavobacteriales bacterium]